MSRRIEDYAVIGDRRTAALVSSGGSIDWFCAPGFDAPACFAALLGDESNGAWSIAPAGDGFTSTRAYRDSTLVLETTFVTPGGSVRLTDCMLLDTPTPRIRRVVEGITGTVAMSLDYAVRFDYGAIVPWVRRTDGGLLAVAGPDALLLSSDVELEPSGMRHVAAFSVAPGERVAFELTYYSSFEASPEHPRLPDALTDETAEKWRAWAGAVRLRRTVSRRRASLVAHVARANVPTDGRHHRGRDDLASGTSRRQAKLGLSLLLAARRDPDALRATLRWIRRIGRRVARVAAACVAGSPDDLQIVYSVRGARRLRRSSCRGLPDTRARGPFASVTTRTDNFNTDVYGEVVDFMYTSERFGVKHSPDDWSLIAAIVDLVVRRWREPDRGLWEIRGEPLHFTHSKTMAWVALDRGVRAIEEFGLDGPIDLWRATRDEIHADVWHDGYDAERGTFTQSYGSSALDASTLLMPSVGFLPYDDERIVGTVAAIERDLLSGGFVQRYTQGPDETTDGLPPGEGAFLGVQLLARRQLRDDGPARRSRGALRASRRALQRRRVARRRVRHGRPPPGGQFPAGVLARRIDQFGLNLWHTLRPVEHRAIVNAEA